MQSLNLHKQYDVFNCIWYLINKVIKVMKLLCHQNLVENEINMLHFSLIQLMHCLIYAQLSVVGLAHRPSSGCLLDLGFKLITL